MPAPKRILRINKVAPVKSHNAFNWDLGKIAFGEREEERGHEGSPVKKEYRVIHNSTKP